MELNADFSKHVIIHSDEVQWLASPMPGVDRRMLDRIGGEVARATTIVRYAPAINFSTHTHTGGEEFIVLDGIFQDEHGDYPEGTYVRNPPTTSHTPGSVVGCTIFVKLWQFDMDDRNQFRKTMSDELPPPVDGVALAVLHKDQFETVSYAHVDASTVLEVTADGGIEILMIAGHMTQDSLILKKGSWLRLPEGVNLKAITGPEGAKVWMKSGHIPHAKPPTV